MRMGRDLEDYFRSAEEDGADLWHKLRAQAVANTQNAYQRGRQVYDDAVRTGRAVVAQTPSQVARLGRAANAVARAAGNGASLGAADNLEAGTEALVGMGGSGSLGQRYQRQLALQHQADADAQREFPNLYKWSGRAGMVGGMLAADSPAVAAGAARMLPGGAKLVQGLENFRPAGFISKGYGRMAAGIGGAVNAAVQAGDDAVNGRPVTFGKEADAFASGAAGTAAATRVGPVLGAALGGALNTGLQEVGQGGVSVDDVLNSGLASADLGRGFATLGQAASNGLPMAVKGDLGQALTFAKSWSRGEPIPLKPRYSPAVAASIEDAKEGLAGPQVRIKLGGRRSTVADFTTDWGNALEAKFGLSAGLTPSQRLAVRKLGALFQPDHWSPGDIGDMAGAAFGSGAYNADDGSQQ